MGGIYKDWARRMQDDDRYEPLIKEAVSFCLENIDDHWEWCSENVNRAFYGYDFIATKEEYLDDLRDTVEFEYEKLRTAARQKYQSGLKEARATVKAYKHVLADYLDK